MGVNRVGVFATEATVNSEKYALELTKYNPNIQVKEIAAKNWVGIVEGVEKNREENIKNIKYEIEEMLEFNPDKIILGCTHYPYLMSEFIKYAPRELFIDPAQIFVDYIKNDLNKSGLLTTSQNAGAEEFFVSSNPEGFVKNSELFYKLHTLPVLI